GALDKNIGDSRRLGDAIFRGRCKRETDRGAKSDAMPGRYINRSRRIARPDRSPDTLVPSDHPGETPARFAKRLMLADQDRFRASDRRNIEDVAHVRGESEA